MRAEPANAPSDDRARKRSLVEALYRKYSRVLQRFLTRRHLTREEIADIVQETYCRMHQVADVEGIRYPRAFIFRVANNLLSNTEKHRSHGIEEDAANLEIFEVAAEDPGPYRLLQAEQELAIVRAAFLELAPKCRRVFVMNRFENLSYPEIARELNVSVSMIEKYISQALAHMKTRLASAGLPAKALRLLK